MSKVLVDRELLEQIVNTNMADYAVIAYQHKEIRSILARPAEAEWVEPVEFWVLFDATTPEPHIKKMMPAGFLAFFDHEEDAIRAKSFHPGTDYKRVPYVRQSDHLAALSAVTAERDRLREVAELLSRLRGLINCTPENDTDKIPVWISTKHPTIERIDALLAAMAAKEA